MSRSDTFGQMWLKQGNDIFIFISLKWGYYFCMKKYILTFGIGVLAVFSTVGVASAAGTNPWDSIWGAIEDLQTQISELSLIPGPQGPEGPQGPQGPVGPQGIQGPVGPQGSVGAQGVQGPVGPAGAVGAQGAQGVQGAQGLAGATGATGATGPQGPAGAGLSRSQTYKVESSVSIDPGTLGETSASCADDNDVLLSGGYRLPSPGMQVYRSEAFPFFANQTWVATAVNNGEISGVLRVSALCLGVE